MERQSVCVISMSTAWSFAIILMAFDPLIMKYTLQPHSIFLNLCWSMVVLVTSACLQVKCDCSWLSQWSPREPCNVVHFWLWGYAVIWVGDGSTSAGGLSLETKWLNVIMIAVSE